MTTIDKWSKLPNTPVINFLTLKLWYLWQKYVTITLPICDNFDDTKILNSDEHSGHNTSLYCDNIADTKMMMLLLNENYMFH